MKMPSPNSHKLKIDPRGHLEIRSLLADISSDEVLPYGDIYLEDKEGHPYLIEVKTHMGDLLTSLATDRLFNQIRGMSEQGQPILITPLIYANKEGFVKVGPSASHWRFTSVEGMLFSLALRGCIIMSASNEWACAQVIRTISTQLWSESPATGGIKSPKMYSFRHEDNRGLKAVCSIDGINRKTGEKLLGWFHTPRRVFTASQDELSEVVSHKIALTIEEVMSTWC